MVQLTAEYVSRKVTKKPGSQIDNKILRKLTHLHLQDSSIELIGDISLCKNLTVLYLHNNCLEKIDNLEFASHLTHLYLQRNKISKIENLNGLRKLKKLYLGHNYIAVIEGLDKLCNLEELHVQKQELPQGETLYFDPRTIRGLARCLQILDVSGNGLISVADLQDLRQLRKLVARNNCIHDIADLTRSVSLWARLTDLELQGNPVCTQQKYRERIITNSINLVQLDGKQINSTTRDFLKRLEISKARHQMAPYAVNTTPNLPPDITNLTKNFTPGITKSITQAILQDSELEVYTSENIDKLSKCSLFPPWNACYDSDILARAGSLVPRPFWRQVNTGQHNKRRTKKIIENLNLPHL